jgi:outer membrane usher protein
VGPGFRNLFLEPADHELVTADGSLTTSLGRLGSLTVGATLGGPDAFSSRTTQVTPDLVGRVAIPSTTALQTTASSQHDRLLRLGYSVGLTSRVQLSLNATRTDKQNGPTSWEGFGSLTFALGWRTVASSLTTVDPDGKALTTVNLQRSLPLGPGFGFRIDADAQDPFRTQGVFEVQSRRAIIGVRADASKDSETVGTINLAGSIVGIGGQVLLSRPVDDGFALVRVPDIRGVQVFANNQEQGRTGRNGSLFVPELQSYLSSPISINQDDVPVEVKLGEVSQNVAVPYRGGAVVTFDAKLIRAITGRLEVAGAQPSYGTLSIDLAGQRFSSPLNVTGEFYFEDLPPGDHPAIATWDSRSCRATVRMPTGTRPMINVGVIPCVEEAK